MAVAAQEQGLLPLNQMSMQFFGRTSSHDYEGIALDLDERVRLVADLGSHHAMILRNHGTLALGRTIPQAFATIYVLEKACELQILAMSTGQPLVTPSDASRAKVVEQSTPFADFMQRYGETAWPGLLALIDAANPGYRDL